LLSNLQFVKLIKIMMKKLLFLLLITLLGVTSAAQNLFLKSGTYDVSSMNKSSLNLLEEELFDGFVFRIIVFNDLPNQDQKTSLKEAGIELLDYLPNNAFFASIEKSASEIDLNAYSIAKILDIQPVFKTSKDLANGEIPSWAIQDAHHITVIAKYFQNLNDLKVVSDLRKKSLIIRDSLSSQNLIEITISKANLDSLYALPYIQFVEAKQPPGEPENLPGRTNHRSNTLWTNATNGLKYRGEGFKIMMQDDGYIGPHIDFEGRIDQSACFSCSSSSNDNHGDHVGGTIMGAGNLDPTAKGMAHGADLLVYNSSNNNYSSVPNLYQNDDVYITSKSYSNGCNGGYTALTQQLDEQVRTYPSLIHVFSAGNAGFDDCGYGAGAGWGNITGGHKSGKNVIAVGNLTSNGNLNGSSSRGPATDGRIKPDICGVGTDVYSTIFDNEYASFTGTSMSCPGVAGTITQLYDAYEDINNGQIPDAGLIKGVVLNTADDLGNPGPDFKHGWGSINALRSYQVIEDTAFIVGTIADGAINSHTISVPSDVQELRVMVYWTDYEASTSASIALVNDLNAVLVDPLGTSFEPWVLDATSNATSLDADAIRGIDNLNNMEQITINQPDPGSYLLSVNGFNIPQGPQEYHVIYYFETSDIDITYPAGGEGLNSGQTHTIRWNAPAGTDPFTIDFSEDNGVSWNSIGSAGANERSFNWSVPSGTVTGNAKIRIERNSISGENNDVFSVISTPTSLGLEWVCPDSVMVSWDPVGNAIGYEVSMLGPKYMDSITYVTDTNAVIQIPLSTTTWFSVKSYGINDAIGERAIAIEKTTDELGCVWSDPIAGFDIDCPVAGEDYCFTLFEESVNTSQNLNVTWYFPDGSPSTSTDVSPQVCYSAPGFYDVIMVVDNGFGTDSIFVANYIEVLPTSQIPYFEGFEDYSTFNNNDYWTSENETGGNASFVVSSTSALSGTNSAFLQNFGQPDESIDNLTSGPLNLSVLQQSENITLSFRYAYRKRNTSNDEWLRVFITASCLDPWVQRKTIKGDLLSDIVASNFWTPSGPEDWTTVHMTNVTSSYFQEDFRVRFQFESDGGNNFYLDDINLYQGDPSDEIVLVGLDENNMNNFNVFPNPTEDVLNIRFDQIAGNPATVIITDVSGKQVMEQNIMSAKGDNLVVLDVESLSPGIYMVGLLQGGLVKTKKVVIQ
jgi:hypothetical protein